MNNLSYNYSSVKQRDRRLYSVSGTKISDTGLSFGLLKIMGVTVGIMNIIGIAICMIAGKNLYNPFHGNKIDPTFVMVIEGLGIGMACALWFIKVQNYRLVEFLGALIKPKYTYDELGKKIQLKKITSDTFIERGF